MSDRPLPPRRSQSRPAERPARRRRSASGGRRPAKRKKASSNVWVWIAGLVGGAGVLGLLCCGGLIALVGQIEREEAERHADTAAAMQNGGTLREAVADFRTNLGPPEPADGPPFPPPPGAPFSLVSYSSPVGQLPAYLSTEVADGSLPADANRPAIVWITGGDCNSIGPIWEPGPPENDQTASPIWQSGVVAMFPSLRGGNANPGQREGFLGEVEDVVAAAEYLAAQPGVDPNRIYLGGHSTGGTLAALVTERSDRFRATFAFGPVFDVRDYGGSFLYHRPTDSTQEAAVRSPGYWLADVRTPLFLIEGDSGNASSLVQMRDATTNPLVRSFVVPGADHFDVLSPATAAIAAAILKDDGPRCTIDLTVNQLSGR